MRPNDAPLTGSSSFGSTSVTSVPQKRRFPKSSRVPGRNGPITFFMRSEDDLDQSQSSSGPAPDDSTYGVRSLDSTQELSDGAETRDGLGSVYDDEADEPLQPRIWEGASNSILSTPPYHYPYADGSFTSSLVQPPLPGLGATRLSGPLTPLYLRSPVAGSAGTESMPSTPKSMSIKSLRLSDDDSVHDDATSQAVMSSGEEDNEQDDEQIENSAPQLVMPSISMPSRRPFTERGRNLGKLKILVAGSKDSGKTSLIRSIVQSCHDIVHVDSLPSSASTLYHNSSRPKGRNSNQLHSTTRQINEIHASTRPYPTWWSDLDESKTLRRKRSNNEPVLERNICFVDTPGFHERSDEEAIIEEIVDYVQGLLNRTQAFSSLSDMEMLNILSGNGGVQVDLVIYVLTGTISSADVRFIRRLSEFTNVLPVIAKADQISPDDIQELKSSARELIRPSHSLPSLLGGSLFESSNASLTDNLEYPYAVSSAVSSDNDNMDASLLMSSTYIQPLVHSELSDLIERIFDPETTAILRHSSARKFLQWRRATLDISRNSPLGRISIPLLHASTTTSGTSSLLTSPQLLGLGTTQHHLELSSPTFPLKLTHLAEHTQREERLTQVRLARWAADLQRSLANERERYARLQREERRAWLSERMNECNDEEKAAAAATVVEGGFSRRRGPAPWAMRTTSEPTNPFTLLGLNLKTMLSSRGLMVAKVLGGCGIIGALTIWVVRNWDYGVEMVFGGSVSISTGYRLDDAAIIDRYWSKVW